MFWRKWCVTAAVLSLVPVIHASTWGTATYDPNSPPWSNVTVLGMAIMSNASSFQSSYIDGGITFTSNDNTFQRIDPSMGSWYNWGVPGNFMLRSGDNPSAQKVHMDFASMTAFGLLLGTGNGTGRGQTVTVKLSNGDQYAVNTGLNGTTALQFWGVTLPNTSPITWAEFTVPANSYLVFDDVRYGTYSASVDPPPSEAPEIMTLLLCGAGLLLLVKMGHKLEPLG